MSGRKGKTIFTNRQNKVVLFVFLFFNGKI